MFNTLQTYLHMHFFSGYITLNIYIFKLVCKLEKKETRFFESYKWEYN